MISCRPEKDVSFTFSPFIYRTPITILGCFSIFSLLLIQYFSHTSYRDPTSYFFDPSRAYTRIYSVDRSREADEFIQSASLLHNAPHHSPQQPRMCIGVAIVTRKGEQYVRQTIGSLLEGLSEQDRDSIHLTIFIDHTIASQDPIYSEKWIETLPNKVLEYKSEDKAQVEGWVEDGNYQFKSVFDYKYLLQDCYTTSAH
jgi:N-Acetylglucosaminyltransferase-IV (GnT-IV) conserved region